jgi:hypothetical protein
MHFETLRHIRDHAKVVGTARQLLQEIGLHVNRHTGEAFDLSVERLAYHLEVTPQWVRQLRARLVQAGELEVRQSRGRHPNVYRIPYERCALCQAAAAEKHRQYKAKAADANPKLELRVDIIPDDINPQLTGAQPATHVLPTRNSARRWQQRKTLRNQHDEPETLAPKDYYLKTEEKDRGESAHALKPEMHNPFWCDAHGFCHGERLPDHRPDCARER